MTNITLKTKQGDTVKKTQHEVEALNLFQLSDSLKVVKDVFAMMQDDPALQDLFTELFAEGAADDETLDSQFLRHAVGAFEVLLVNVPEKAYELLSAMSGIKLDVLKEQKVIEVFDIYDAILEVNDIEKLITRAKKSLAATKVKMNFMKIAKKATAVTAVQ